MPSDAPGRQGRGGPRGRRRDRRRRARERGPDPPVPTSSRRATAWCSSRPTTTRASSRARARPAWRSWSSSLELGYARRAGHGAGAHRRGRAVVRGGHGGQGAAAGCHDPRRGAGAGRGRPRLAARGAHRALGPGADRADVRGRHARLVPGDAHVRASAGAAGRGHRRCPRTRSRGRWCVRHAAHGWCWSRRAPRRWRPGCSTPRSCLPTGPVVALLSGGNVDPDTYAACIAAGVAAGG